jgi:hypothetical protein
MNENLKFILILAAIFAWGAFIPICHQTLIGVLLLSFIVPLALIGLSIWLWRARQSGIAVLLGALALILFLAFGLNSGSVNLLIDWVRGETTPQAKVVAYLEAIARGDEEAALAMWPAQGRLGPDYEERRRAVTGELLALDGDLSYRILNVEWWRTCCEPGVIEDPREAGFARLRVAVGDAVYIFDILAPYYWWEDRYLAWGWRIVDVYHEGEAHLAWPYPLPTPTPAPPPRKLIVEDVAVRMRPGVIELEGRIDLPPGTELMAVLQRDGKDWYWADPDARRTAGDGVGQMACGGSVRLCLAGERGRAHSPSAPSVGTGVLGRLLYALAVQLPAGLPSLGRSSPMWGLFDLLRAPFGRHLAVP